MPLFPMAGGIVLATGDGGLVTEHTIPVAVLVLTTPMTEPPILVVYLKKFTFHTKHLKIFY